MAAAGHKTHLYEMIASELALAIDAGRFPDGQLPPEREIASDRGVGLVTVRKAMDILVRRKLVVRRSGAGTFIRKAGAQPVSRRRRTHLISYISGAGSERIPGGIYNRLMLYAQRFAESRGYSCAFSTAGGQPLPKPIANRRVDGALLAGTYWPSANQEPIPDSLVQDNNAFIRRIVESGYPLVAMNNLTEHPGAHTVNPDHRGGMREALVHLAQRGHRSVGYCGGEGAWPVFGERLDAFRTEAKRAGLKAADDWVVTFATHGQADEAVVMRRVRAVLSKPKRPTALVFGTGSAQRPLAAARAAGLRVGEDLSVIALSDTVPTGGDDDLGIPAALLPPEELAVIAMPVADIACAAVERLVSLLDGHTYTPRQRTVRVPMKLYLGPSVGRPAK